MNEEALKVLFDLAKKDGYTKNFKEFVRLMSSNEQAVDQMFELARTDGYTKELEDFRFLVGLKKKDESQPTGQEEDMVSDIPVVEEETTSLESLPDAPQAQIEESVVGEVPDEFGGGDVVQFEAGRRHRGQRSTREEEARDRSASLFDGRRGIVATGEKDTALERTFGKNQVTDFFGDIWRAGAKGIETGNTVDEAMEIMYKGKDASSQDIQDYLDASEALAERGESDEMRSFNQAFEAAGGGAWGFLMGMWDSPTAISEIAITSITQMANPASAAAAGATTAAFTGGGAGIGALAGGVGAAPGAVIGAAASIPYAIGAAGATLEAGLSFSEFLQEEIAGKGLELDEAGVRAVFADPEAMLRIRMKAAGRGVVIGVIDGLTAGVAGKIGAGITKTGVKTSKALKRSKLEALGAGTVVEGIGGGVGEATARAVVGQEMDALEIGFEMVGGGPGSILSVGPTLLGKGKYAFGPDGAPMTREEMITMVTDTDDATFAGAKLEIKGDPGLKALAEERKDKLRQKKAKIEQLGEDLDNLSVEDAEAAIELETELDAVKGGVTRARRNRKKEIESQLDEIYSRRQEPAVEAVVEVTTEEAVADTDVITEELDANPRKDKAPVYRKGGKKLLFTGSPRKFTTFDMSKVGSNADAGSPKGIFFSNDPGVAGFYANEVNGDGMGQLLNMVGLGKLKGIEPTIYSAVLNTDNVKEVEFNGESSSSTMDKNAIIQEAFAEGFEAVVLKNIKDGPSVPQDVTVVRDIKFIDQFTDTKDGKGRKLSRNLLNQKQDAIQESSTTEVDVQEQTQDGTAVGERDATGGVAVESESQAEVSPEATQEEIEQGAADLESLLNSLSDSPVNVGDLTSGRNKNVAPGENTTVEVVSGIDAEGNPVMAPAQPGVAVSENLTVVDQTETDSHYGSENFRRENPNETPQQHEEMLMERVDKALKSVKRLFPKLKIVMHRSEASYKDNVSTNSRGAFNPNTNTIHINMPKATGRTIGHEVFHAILKDRFGSEANIQVATKALIKSLRAGINKSTNLTPEQVLELERYAQIFDGDKAIVQDEEFLAEFVGFLSETYSKLEVPQQTAIKQWLAKIAQIFGFSPQEVLAQADRDVVDLLNTIAGKVTEGKEIAEADIKSLEKLKDKKKPAAKKPVAKKPAAKKPVAKKPAAKKPKALSAREKSALKIAERDGKISMGVLKKELALGFAEAGDVISLLEDRGLVAPFSGSPVREYIDPKIKTQAITEIEGGQKVSEPASALKTQAIGAFEVSYTQQEKVAQMIKEGLITEPDDVSFLKGNDTVITSPDDMLVGEISLNGKPIFEGGGGVFFVTKYGEVWAAGKKDPAKRIAEGINRGLKENGGKGYLTLTKGADKKLVSSASGVNSTLAILDSMLDEGLVSPSNFRAAVSSAVKRAGGEIDLRGSSKKLKADVNKYFSDPSTTTFEKRGNIVESIVGEIAKSLPKESRPKVVQFLGGDPNKSVGATKTPKSQRLVDLVAGVAAEKLTKGLSVGDVYAVIEVDGEVEVVKGDHKSYPWHVRMKDGSKPILHLPKNREAGGKALVQKSGKPYAVRNVSVVEGKFQGQTEAIKTQAYSDDLMYQYGQYTDKNGELDVDLVLEKIDEDIASLKNKDLIEEKLKAFEELIIPAISEDITSPALTQFESDVLMDPNATAESIERGFRKAKNIIDKEGSIDFSKTKESDLFKGGEINLPAFERFVDKNPEYQGVFNDWEKLFTESTEVLLKDLNAFNVVDIELAESFKKQLQQTEIKTQVFNPTNTTEDIIKFGRENNFSDAMIKDYLVRIKKEKVKEVNKMMAIDADMFRQMPVSFGNIEGGARVGVKLFARVEKFMQKLNAKNNKRKESNRISDREIMDQTIEFLEKQPEYIAESGKRKQETDQQTQMIIDMQKALGVNPTKGMNTRIREMRQKMMERRRGGMDLQAVKRDLRNFIRQALPTIKGSTYSKSELMNLLGKVTKADKKNIANLMDEVVDIVTTRQVKALDSKIESILNGKYEVVQAGRLKGVKIDTDTRQRLERIKDAVTDEAMTEEDIVESNLGLNEEFNVLNEKPNQTEEDRNRMVDLAAIMSINNSKLMEDVDIDKLESLSTAEDLLADIIGEGKEAFKEQLKADHERYVSNLVRVYKVVTGETIDPSDPQVMQEAKEILKDLKNRKESRAAEKGLKKYVRKIIEKISAFKKSSESVEGLMEIIAEAPGEILGGDARKIVYEGLNAGTRVYKKRMMEATKVIQDKVKEIYGKNWRKQSRVNSVRKDTGVYRTGGKEAIERAQKKYDANPTTLNKRNLAKVKAAKTINLSPNEIAQQWQQYQDPANLPSFANEDNLYFGEDHARIMAELVETIGGEDGKILEMAKWQIEEFYPSMYPHLNEAYKNIYRTNMPWNVHYAGRIKREGVESQGLDLLGRKESFNTQVGAASTKVRIKNAKPIQPMDMMGAMVTYTTDMEWFAAMGPTIRDIDKLFSNPLMRNAIENVAGESTMRLIDHHMKNIAARGVNTERGQDLVNAMNNMFATTRLGFSPNIAIKQLTSIPTYALDIGAGNYAYHAAKNKTEFLKVFNEIRNNSVYLQDRVSTDIRQVTESYSGKQDIDFVPKSASSWFMNTMMGFIKAGDITAIYLGGMPNYSFYKAEYMKANPNATEQQAIDHAIVKFEADTKSTQQSMDLQDKDFYQTSGAFARSFNLFKTSQKQYLRKEFSGLRNMRRGLRDGDMKQAGEGICEICYVPRDDARSIPIYSFRIAWINERLG